MPRIGVLMGRTIRHTVTALAALTALAAPTVADARSHRPDTTRPTVQLTAPDDGSTVSGTSTVAADASDNRAVDHVAFRIDGVPLASDYTAPYSVPWDTTSVADGSHTVTARAQDTSGNVSASPDPSRTVTVSNGAPPPPPPPPPGGTYYPLAPMHSGQAHDDAYCSANLTPQTEVHSATNSTPNHTLGNYASATWD